MASASSSSSSTTARSSKSKKRRWTRDQLLRNLEILGPLSDPLPPALPPSPPASRSASPAPPLKRKSDFLGDHNDSVKRPRTAERNGHSIPERPSQHQHRSSSSTSSPNAQAPTPRSNHPPIAEPCEDGEVREEAESVASTSVAASATASVPIHSRSPPAVSAPTADPDPISSFTPIHRPRRGRPSPTYTDELHDKYHKYGRMLKYSGDARFWSTYPSTHKEYRPLPNPPPPNSPYHKHGGLVARLELLDALVCFTYSTWTKDHGRRTCDLNTWATMDPFLKWCKHKWSAEDGYNDAERALQGLIYMIEGFIMSRKLVYNCRTAPGQDIKRLHNEMSSNMMAAAREAKSKSSGASAAGGINGTGLIPASAHQLPSPASIATASSANSTPTNPGARPSSTHSSASSSSHRPNGTVSARPQLPSTPLPSIPHGFLPESMRSHYDQIPSQVLTAMSSVTVKVAASQLQDITDLVMMMNTSSSLLGTANQMLNLPILRKSFPRTYARMVHSTLSPQEELEPEFEDEDGELFWPGQSVSGEGLGWVCLMGKAMIVEFGKAYGYAGLAGVVPKPPAGEEREKRR
ncbi:hypothetical protein BDN71DRAFT_1500823 [Pleurotus eryngii]|uniref:Uncharacterized protein n=1 Tax=Pleurotus eryngii TaxID=5323 RepID=A0A9P6DKE3_PLEER|nr:hypothetical protein BDN71DRAFT_1500823 [Pleurotus eryngii]